MARASPALTAEAPRIAWLAAIDSAGASYTQLSPLSSNAAQAARAVAQLQQVRPPPRASTPAIVAAGVERPSGGLSIRSGNVRRPLHVC